MSGSELPFTDRFTGCLLGMAIGDAIGTGRAFNAPWAASDESEQLHYRPRPGSGDAPEIPGGQFSLNTELSFCLLETIVTSDGFVDPEFATYRFEHAIQKTDYLIDEREKRAILFASDHEEFQSGGNERSRSYAGPPARVIPVSMAHSLSDMNLALLTREVLRACLITDGSPEVVNGSLAVALAVRLALRHELPLELFIDEILSLIDEDAVAHRLRVPDPDSHPVTVSDVVSTALHAFVSAEGDLENALTRILRRGGATHLTGAVAGALCGAYAGGSTLPPELVDGLEGRAYVLMAAPALLRTAQLRAGLVFQLHLR